MASLSDGRKLAHDKGGVSMPGWEQVAAPSGGGWVSPGLVCETEKEGAGQVYAPVLCHGEEGAECESKAVELPVDHLWPWTLNSNQNNDGSHTSGGKAVPLKGV